MGTPSGAERRQRLGRDTSGASAIEFGLGAMILIPALLWMTDLGLGFVARMELERHIRTGAEAVMLRESDPDVVRMLVMAVARDTPGIREATVTRLCDGEPTEDDECAEDERSHFRILLTRERQSLFNMREPYELEASSRVRIR